MCRVFVIHPSGFYAWLKEPLSLRAKENHRLTALIKQPWLESGCVYVYRKIHSDLQSIDEQGSLNFVAKLMQLAELKAQIGYKRRKQYMVESQLWLLLIV